jgi:hypothetical protein
MLARGEPMTLRRVSLLAGGGAVPYSNPPSYSTDIAVTGAVTGTDSNTYLGLAATTLSGRLVAGDQILVNGVAWTVQTMPTDVLTDSDGIPLGFNTGRGGSQPSFGVPTIYNADTLAANNAFPVICVTSPGPLLPVQMIGQPVTFDFLADEQVFGRVLTLEEMTQKGWTQVNTLGLNIAAMANGVPVALPAVDDLIYVNGEERSIMAVGPIFRNGVNFLYSLQCH